MYLTYAAGAVGLFIGFLTVAQTPPSLTWAALLAVGLGGGLSFLRHSIFHRSDAVRLKWDSGQRNNFQIEVGLANLAWALLAVTAVIFDWGLAVEAASFLVFGFYLVAVSVMLVGSRGQGPSRPWAATIGMATFGVMLCIVGVLGLRAA
jgi:hypothetical protein